MKILFICSSLEPGKDGVGDYTRKLACGLNNRGCITKIVALNDRRIQTDFWQGYQSDEGTETEVLRLSSALSWHERIQKAKAFITRFNPEWVSLQFVPFSFHLKGLPLNLHKKLMQVAGHRRWHIMFHELSVNRSESLKFRVWSLLQVQIIKLLAAGLHPGVIHTNTRLYQYRLAEMGIPATVLPLFSNIAKTAPLQHHNAFEAEVPAFLAAHRQNYVVGTLFGSFDYKRWDMRSLLDKFTKGLNKKRVVIVSLGGMTSGAGCWQQLKLQYPQLVFLTLGNRSAGFISYWLSHYTDFGILTTLPELATKSGSFMAFKEHGIPVVCREKSPSLDGYHLPAEKQLVEVTADAPFYLPGKYQPVAQLPTVCNLFINELSANNTQVPVAAEQV